MAELSVREIRSARLASLLLAEHNERTAEAVVGWFGAMQAQDLASVKWSLGVRLPALASVDIDAAFERGKILRTWPMRGTIHLIPATDARWMLETMGVRALSGVEKRWAYLDLDRATVERADDVLGQALQGGRRLTRGECSDVLQDSGIKTTGQRLYHLLWHASQVGITCIGPTVGKDQTFALLDDFAPEQRRLTHDEALVELAWYFVRGHGPVPVKDFAGWAGIPMGQARKALAGNEGRIRKIETDLGEQWIRSDQDLDTNGFTLGVLALPGFDEFMLGYKDRAAMLDPGQLNAVIPGNNGVFRPTVVDCGKVVGTWTKSQTTKQVRVLVTPLEPLDPAKQVEFTRSATRYAAYLGLDPVVSFGEVVS